MEGVPLESVQSRNHRQPAAASALHLQPPGMLNRSLQASRPDSTSSSSIVTVKRAASVHLPPGLAPSTTPLYTRISGSEEASSWDDLHEETSPTKRRRSNSVQNRENSRDGVSDGVGNLNRWSQSSLSSISSTGQKRKNSFTRRISWGYTNGEDDGSRKRSMFGEQPTTNNPRGASTLARPYELPPLTALPPIFSGFVDSSSTPNLSSASSFGVDSATSAVPSPSTNSSYLPEYFGVDDKPLTHSRSSPKKNFLVLRAREYSERRNLRRSMSSGGPAEPMTSSKPKPKQSPKSPKSPSYLSSPEKPRGWRQKSSEDLRAASRYRKTDTGATMTGTTDDVDVIRPRTRERREKDKKVMLSKALQMANTAVLMDNAQQVEGAIDAYEDACNLLQRVMLRTPSDEDRKKLDVVWATYQKRIQELEPLDTRIKSEDEESIKLEPTPTRQNSVEAMAGRAKPSAQNGEPAALSTSTRATAEDSGRQPSPLSLPERDAKRPHHYDLEDRRNDSVVLLGNPSTTNQDDGQPPASLLKQSTLNIPSPMHHGYMPAPLSPRRPSPTTPLAEAFAPETHVRDSLPDPNRALVEAKARGANSDSVSWLDTIGESGASSCSSSVHSTSSRDGLHRKHLRNGSGRTEAEFDAALDAAVEAAYDDGFEPYETEGEKRRRPSDTALRVIKNVELAKEKVREAEREAAQQLARMGENGALVNLDGSPETLGEPKEDGRAVELPEGHRKFSHSARMTDLAGPEADLQSRPAQTRDSSSSKIRQSGSSSASARTWKSSIGSTPTTASTSLSTVAESPLNAALRSSPFADLPPPGPPPTGALPPAPTTSTTSARGLQNGGRGLRSRRFSGQNALQLKIETSSAFGPPLQTPTQNTESSSVDAAKAESRSAAPRFAQAINPTGQYMLQTTARLLGQTLSQANNRPLPSPLLSPSPADTLHSASPATTALSQTQTNESGSSFAASPGRKAIRPIAQPFSVKKTKSVSSLKGRNYSQSYFDTEVLPPTPMSTTFSTFSRPKLPTPLTATFNTAPTFAAGAYVFDSEIHEPSSPKSPDRSPANAPLPLEACPESFLLRPFWLMRCIYQTLVHPKGGYITSKLFVPREVWLTRGVRLKNVDEKINACDLLSAGLAKIRQADTLDVDALLEEMQAFEALLDQVQATLSKKLSGEVGVHGVGALFKDAPASPSAHGTAGGGDAAHDDADSKKPGGGATGRQGFMDSWRKLRQKGSGAGTAAVTAPGTAHKSDHHAVAPASLAMASVPMTGLPSIRFSRRREMALEGVRAASGAAVVVGAGPHALYMSALARLCDAVGVLDQIARQVEDPGLKHSSPTHVGLELSVRHAAEFFAFYVCRWVVGDVTVLLEKSIKRATEFVLA